MDRLKELKVLKVFKILKMSAMLARLRRMSRLSRLSRLGRLWRLKTVKGLNNGLNNESATLVPRLEEAQGSHRKTNANCLIVDDIIAEPVHTTDRKRRK